MIENAFRAGDPVDAPETFVLAWLALLGPSANAPTAAAELTSQLLRHHNGRLTFWQARLIELLAFVAQHTRPTSRNGQ